VAEFVDSIAGPDAKNRDKTSVLLFFGRDEWRAMVEAKLAGTFDPKKPPVRPRSADILLFGRMLAEATSFNVDAACQVAHAISTNRLSQEMDYWTALDERQPQEEPGAGNIGNQEFNSSCFYRYACISGAKLQENYGDADMTKAAINAFLRASYEAIPTGKLNSFGNFTPPEFAMITVRHGGYPRNLVNAFDPAITPGEHGLTRQSIGHLCKYYDLRSESESDNRPAFDGYWWLEGEEPRWWDTRVHDGKPKGWTHWASDRRSHGYPELVSAAMEHL